MNNQRPIMRIRTATSQDRDEVRGVHLSAFPEGEGEVVSQLAVDLLGEETTPPTISLVAEIESTVVGHVAFSPVTCSTVAFDSHENWQGYILAPLAVAPDYQKRRIGSKLIENGIQQLLERGVNLLFVYGDPQYYSKFGFSADATERYSPPYPLEYPFGWQAIVLKETPKEDRIAKSSIKIACVNSLCDPELW